MPIRFDSIEDAMLHAQHDHDVDCDYLRTARRFESTRERSWTDILEAADVLHITGFFHDIQEVLDFFETPWRYTDDVWQAAATQAGVNADDCYYCD